MIRNAATPTYTVPCQHPHLVPNTHYDELPEQDATPTIRTSPERSRYRSDGTAYWPHLPNFPDKH